MTNRIVRRTLILLALLLAGMGSASSQVPAAQSAASLKARPRAVSYNFVSPNTRENLTFAEALRLLNSKEEVQLVKDIQRRSRCLGLRPVIRKTIGSWADGAEHSTVFRIHTDVETMTYIDAWLGRTKRQKAVLCFRQDPLGKGRMYILTLKRGGGNLASIIRVLDRNAVSFRTLIPGAAGRTLVYVVDLNNELRKQVSSAARRLRARLSHISGAGVFIGDDTDRDKAQQVFTEIVERYEGQYPEVTRKCGP